MIQLKVVFSSDPSGFLPVEEEKVYIPMGTCLYSLEDKRNRLCNEIKNILKDKRRDVEYFEILKVYTTT